MTPAPHLRDGMLHSAPADGADGRGRDGPPGAVAAVALVLAYAWLLAVVSHGAPVWRLVREGHANRAEILARVGVVWGLGVIAVVGIALTVHRVGAARPAGSPPLRTMLRRAVPITTVALVVVSLLAVAGMDLDGGPAAGDGPRSTTEMPDRRGTPFGISDQRNPPVRAGDGADEPDAPGDAEPDAGGAFPYLLIVAAVATVALGAAAWRWHGNRKPGGERRHEAGDPPADRLGRAVHGAVTGTIDAMLADRDPNTAVIGAYARLLERLDACGAGRRAHEGPMEHLRRTFTMLDVHPEPLRRLTGLFEIARFSIRPLTASDREQALDALRTVAADLAGASTARPGTADPPPRGARQ